MAHHTANSSYSKLIERLNRFPQGAPSSERLYKILNVLMNEKEAEWVSLLPIKPFTVKKAARIWKTDRNSAQKVLDELAGRALLVDIAHGEENEYTLPPPMAGFIEFSMMRIRDDVDQKLLSELYYQYINVEEDFIKDLMLRGETQLGRVYVQERVLSNENALHVLDYERASHIVETASHIGIGMCYCRHKMQHMDRACDAPMDICMTFNTTGASLIKYGHARQVDVVEGLDLLQKAWENNLVQFGENNRENVNFICNCCPCCCEAMIAARKFGILQPVHSSNFLVESLVNECKGCGKCREVCPVDALSLVSADDPKKPKRQRIDIDRNICLGCGVCVRNCKNEALLLESRPERVLTPLNTTHRCVVMAIERGMLQDLIFDNRVLLSHRMMAAVLGVILKLPPLKQVMAAKQVKSRYLETIIKRLDY
ncbi:MAG: 4Fe-4S dicluster domain-containing protein [Proteobacteria bacterium]|nr:4Fe-4S dicluster domain-containing protein [Pseudomonadota bacterium]